MEQNGSTLCGLQVQFVLCCSRPFALYRQEYPVGKKLNQAKEIRLSDQIV